MNPLFKHRLLQRIESIVLIATTMLLLSGCALSDNLFKFAGFTSGSSMTETPDSLAMDALDDFNRGEYDDALKAFTDIKERFPFSRHSVLAELKAADCNFYLGKYPEAIVDYEDFSANHPTNEALPYVLFQIAHSHYRQIDTIDRDPGEAIDAIAAYTKLLNSFPNTAYTEESKARMQAARNFLANHEMYVASYYLRTEEYDQSEGRLKFLIDNYPESSIVPKANELLAAIQSGNPPKRTWRDWVPDIALPDWKTFTTFGQFGGMSSAGPE